MRVLQFYRTYMPETQGGLEEAIRQICIGTGKFGVEQRVLTMARVPRTETLSLPEADVVRVPLQWEPASCSMGLGMFRAYREHAQWADVLHVHYPWPFADLVHLLSGINRPVVLTYHSDIIRQRVLEKLYSPLRSLFFRKVSRLVATSPNYIETSPVLASLTNPAGLVPLGLSPDSYNTPSPRALAEVEQRYGRDFFLFVGVLRYYKGLHTLIAAASRTGLPVVIAGDGPEAKVLKNQAETLGAINVRFAGFVDNDMKQALFKHCRAVVFPSCERSEAFGVTLLEGQLHHKPLISCEIGTGTSYVNVDGETGMIVPVDDPEAFGEAMRKLDNDPDLASRFGRAGRARLDYLFSGSGIGEQYARIYREVLDAHSSFKRSYQ
jgi:glycosyltransferase involved in cell wall biosynthesis